MCVCGDKRQQQQQQLRKSRRRRRRPFAARVEQRLVTFTLTLTQTHSHRRLSLSENDWKCPSSEEVKVHDSLFGTTGEGDGWQCQSLKLLLVVMVVTGVDHAAAAAKAIAQLQQWKSSDFSYHK